MSSRLQLFFICYFSFVSICKTTVNHLLLVFHTVHPENPHGLTFSIITSVLTMTKYFQLPYFSQTPCHFSSYVQDISTCIAHCCYKFSMSKTKPDTFPKIQFQYCHSQVPVKRQSPHQLFGQRVEYKELSRPEVVNCVTTRIEL